MKKSDYQAWVTKSCRGYTDINYCIIAINGEAGEVAEWYKKHELRGNPTGELTEEDLKLELGDLLFYIARLASLKGWSLNDIMDANVEKIEARITAGKRSIA